MAVHLKLTSVLTTIPVLVRLEFLGILEPMQIPVLIKRIW